MFSEWHFTHLNPDIPPQITMEAASVESFKSPFVSAGYRPDFIFLNVQL